MVTQHREREDKYAVGDDFALPDLTDLAGESGRVETEAYVLTNAYHDTTVRGLWAAGVTLRRRSGGHEDGWQLKVPAGSARTEVRSSARSRTVPKALADVVLGLTGGQPLLPVAEITTERTATRLLAADGRLLAEVADDRVSSVSLGGESRLDHWREVEVELGEAGDEDLLAAVGRRLTDAGAAPAAQSSKLAHALGLPPAEEAGTGSAVTVADLVGQYVREQCEEILRGDLALRLGEPRVHKTRVALRRLRSTLRVYRAVLDPEPADRLGTELRWLAGLLGEVRDREVLQARFEGQLAELPVELVLGPVGADLDIALSSERRRHFQQLTVELKTPRQLELLEAVTRWRTEPPFLEGASAPADEIRSYVRVSRQKLRKRLRQAKQASPDKQEDLLHRARKAAKRARYAAELAAPAWAKAERHAERAQELQTVLGEHQDSVVAADFLRRMGAETGSRGGRNGFTYGLLFAREQERASRVRTELDRHKV
ncbi:MAG: CHAD domain-containing protein [Friedmanniella sp.]